MGFFSAIKKFFGQEQNAEGKGAIASPGDEVLGKPAGEPEGNTDAASGATGSSAAAPDSASTIGGGDAQTSSKSEEIREQNEEAGPDVRDNASCGAASGAGESVDLPLPANQADAVAPLETRQADETISGGTVVPAPVTLAGDKEPDSVAAARDVQKSAEPGSDAEQELLLRLRQAEPRLSQWLDIILEDQEEADERFWRRLKFLLRSLDAPETEIEAFAADFERWLLRMEYAYIDEFRSELQYRLALALDLEDEEDERNRLLLKLGTSLAATREQFGRRLDSVFASHGELDDAFWEEMEEMFILSDMGYEPAMEMVARLKRRALKERICKPAEARRLLQDELEYIFRPVARIRAANRPEVFLMMGVNGAGKTTTIAKLAHRERMSGKKTLVVAADTFRAAAIEQLQVWAERAGSDFYAKAAGSDPASVAWEAMDYALKNGIDTVFVDTAGRLQTRVNLMEELGKIRQVLGRKHPGAPHRSMLVLDATTGQNALSQAKLFREAAGADEIALTKLDGTAKGGVAIAVAMREGLPITYIGLGEKMEDLRPFNGRDFAKAILEDPTSAAGS